MASPTETTALLSSSHGGEATALEGPRHRRLVLSIVLVSVVAADFGNALSAAPQLKLYESLICSRLFGHEAAVDDSICKLPKVQSQLATLFGWKGTFDQIPGIALVLFYGWAADRIGRKPVLLLALGGLFFEDAAIRLVAWLSFTTPLSLKAIWYTPLFQVLGGGPSTATSMAYSIITDTFSAIDRASLYFYLGAAILVGEIFATPLSAWLMAWTPWLPLLAGTGCQILAFSAACCLPEKKRARTLVSSSDSADSVGATDNTRLWRQPLNLANTIKSYWKGVVGTKTNYNQIYILVSFALASVGSSSLALMTQYGSRRFSWSIPKASLLLSLKGTINIICLLVLLPYISRILCRNMAAVAAELRIIKGSVMCWATGLAFMAFARQAVPFTIGVVILSLGSGYLASLRSLANALSAQSRVGLLNSQIGFVTGIGSLVAGPSMAAAFQRGMDLDGLWSGFPYIIAAVLFLIATALAWFIDVASDVHEPVPSPDDDE